MTHFRKQPNGSWAFDSPITGTTYYAYRNEAGFAGRDWYVTRLDSTADGTIEVTVEDMLASRKECVQVAEMDAKDQDRRAGYRAQVDAALAAGHDLFGQS
jgi:hypothetical protein